jgi:ornithine decarboxylase
MAAPALTLVSPAVFEDAAAIARHVQPEEPLFCFSATALQAQLEVFRNGFPGLISFAVKSNPSREVIATLAEAGLSHWDVASVHEMAMVHSVTPDAVFHYHNPVKSRREIADAYHKFGCRRFAVDCREELQKIADITGSDPSVEIAVRFVLPRERTSSAHDFSTKFGAPEHIAAALLQDARARSFAAMLTFHPGSQSRDPQVYVRHLEAAARIAEAAGVKVGKINVGGGFPATYPHSAPVTGLDGFFAAISDATWPAEAGMRAWPRPRCGVHVASHPGEARLFGR